jgi:hypothetical protein
MRKDNDEGILINGIMKEIEENIKSKKENNKKENDKKENIKKENNNVPNSDIIKPDSNKKDNIIVIHKKQNSIANKGYSNNLCANKEDLKINNKNNRINSNSKSDYRLNRNLKDINNKKGKSINSNAENCKIIKNSEEKKEINVIKFIENDIENDKESDKEISLYFLLKNGKELYLDIKESCIFKQVINELYEKYLWLKIIRIKEYRYNNNIIFMDKSLKENKLKDNSIINII